MKKIQILMSTYNGASVIAKQIESIMNQENVDVHLLIRDDGSTDRTVKKIIEKQDKYPDKIQLVQGDNKGWKESFVELLFLAKNYDYYGFSDQDDVWNKNKLITCINLMEQDIFYNGVKLAHCNSICTDENLIPRNEQQIRYPMPKSHKMAITYEYFQGCGMVWNRKAMEIIKKHQPNPSIAHDYWVGIICYFFGKVYFCNEPLFFHIRYLNNVSQDGNVNAGRCKRFKNLVKGKKVYMNPCKDLLEGYREYLSSNDYVFLKNCITYRESIFKRMRLLFDVNFRRESIFGTLLFKYAILTGKF